VPKQNARQMRRQAPSDGMAIRNLGRLFHKVPAYELGFSLDGIDREAIRRVLSRSQDPE
jgi:hypothetical protein